MTPQFSWAKELVSLSLLFYLLALLILVLAASHYPEPPGPAIHLTPEHQPQVVPVPDFANIIDVEARKQAFFDFLRPLIAEENRYYQRERDRLLAIVAKVEAGERLNAGDRKKLAQWTKTFSLEKTLTLEEKLDILLRRINTIPESMVLAQAAMESAWGQSRFAQEANNYFGQWCFRPGCGLVPRERSAGARHEVRKFRSVRDAVSAYFININTHRAYRALRNQRLTLEESGEEISGHVLVGNLKNYSQRGQQYVDELRLIIQGNGLEESDETADSTLLP